MQLFLSSIIEVDRADGELTEELWERTVEAAAQWGADFFEVEVEKSAIQKSKNVLWRVLLVR